MCFCIFRILYINNNNKKIKIMNNILKFDDRCTHGKMVKEDSCMSVYAGEEILLGHRIPKDYFITEGSGESDITVHAGSYHLALRDAGIEMCNIMVYSSILPKIAREIEKPEVLTHGSVMECIMATANSESGTRATASIMFGSLYNKSNGERYGGLVCEYNGSKSEEDAAAELKLSLNELYTNGYSEDYSLEGIRTISKSIVPEKKYGTAVVAICFANYLFPIIR